MPDPTTSPSAPSAGPTEVTPSTADELRARLATVMVRDRTRLIGQLRGLRRVSDGAERKRALVMLAGAVAEAEQRVALRAATVPSLSFPAELPISARSTEIVDTLREHRVVIVAGETGSGKSTQLPKLCLAAGRGVRGLIGHTQPRRLAARTVAERVAEEMGSEVGGIVGYTVRFTDRVGERTLVKVMTDGILLAEIQRDRMLERYDTIIVDEAHERSLNVDFLLGYLKQLLPRRPDLSIVITSATIDTARFSEHFDDAPVIEVSGRGYPVEMRYRPLTDDDGDDNGTQRDQGDQGDQIQGICDAVAELDREGPGDVLVFLSGEREIHDTADALRALNMRHTEILPLYARLSSHEQHRIFQPHPGRRIVLATNVAETSLTVPGVRYVVDAGMARISRYSKRLKVQRLPIEAISQASANQRAGRCGRVAPGICIRLYAEDDYRSRPDFTEPEILRTNLASVILQMTAIGLGDLARFPFVDPPDSRSVRDGVALLDELGALAPPRPTVKAGTGSSTTVVPTGQRTLTPLGRRLAQLPLDPRLGRMALEADRQGCVRELLVLTAVLSIQDPRERPVEHRQAADEQHRRFADPHSDFLSLLRLWEYLRELQQTLSSNQFRKRCKAEYLSHLRIREWHDLYSQLRQVCSGMGIHLRTERTDPDHVDEAKADAIHRALLAGLLSQIGMRDPAAAEYLGARGARFAIAPGSVLARKSPPWVMVAELVETNRLWGRVAARIEPEWAEALGAHLVSRTYSEPVWDTKRATAMASERVTLFGLPIVPNRRVSYAPIDSEASREIFVCQALVDGEWLSPHGFRDHNRDAIAAVQALQSKARRRDLLVDDEAIFDFYDQRVPASVVTGRDFDQWWKRERRTRPKLLDLTQSVLLRPDARWVDGHALPDTWTLPPEAVEAGKAGQESASTRKGDAGIPGESLLVTYAWDPGAPDDGATVHVPLLALPKVGTAGFDWQVPGWRFELVSALIKTLPKDIRRHLAPVAPHTDAFCARATPADGPLLGVLARALAQTIGIPIAASDFDPERLPEHLRMKIAVFDVNGRCLAVGTELHALQERFGATVRAAALAEVRAAAGTIEREAVTTWDLEALPREIAVVRQGQRVEAYPALVIEGDRIAVRVLASRFEQELEMRAGTRALLLRSVVSLKAILGRLLSNDGRLALARTGYGTIDALVDDGVAAAVDAIVAAHGGPAWHEAGFAALRSAVRDEVADRAIDLVVVAARAIEAAAAVQARLSRITSPPLALAISDMTSQLARLVAPGFVTATGAAHLADVERYVQAIDRRLDKLADDPRRDRLRMDTVAELSTRHRSLLQAFAPGPVPDEIVAIGWMIEDLRVSLFAQSLKVPHPVSEQRILKALDRWT